MTCPFGLKKSVFTELMSEIFQDINHKFGVHYIDDILVFSFSFTSHLAHSSEIEKILASHHRKTHVMQKSHNQ